jgi:hypothetical protein
MAIAIKKITLWRKEVANDPGALANVLQPLAAAGASLRVVMGYAMGDSGRAAIEVFPVSGKKIGAAAAQAGLGASSTACLLVEGDDRPGLGTRMARAVADQGINIEFVIAQTVGRKFSAVFGLQSESDAAPAAKAIKNAATGKRAR